MIEANIGALQKSAQKALAPFHDLAITAQKIEEALSLVPDMSGDQKLAVLGMLNGKALVCKDAFDDMDAIFKSNEPVEQGDP